MSFSDARFREAADDCGLLCSPYRALIIRRKWNQRPRRAFLFKQVLLPEQGHFDRYPATGKG
jgi:hypothetical protein